MKSINESIIKSSSFSTAFVYHFHVVYGKNTMLHMSLLRRKIITKYKDSPAGRTKASLNKQHFPELLNKLLSALGPNQASNLQSGFRKCSVYPMNVNELLTKFRERESYDREALEDSFKIFLQDKFKSLESVGTNKRKKKLSVPAGKSVSIKDLEKFNEGYDIVSKNLAKRKKQT